MVKNPPAIQDTWVQSLGQEHPLEKEIAPTPVFLPGKSQGQRSLPGYSPGSPLKYVSVAVKYQHLLPEKKNSMKFFFVFP